MISHRDSTIYIHEAANARQDITVSMKGADNRGLHGWPQRQQSSNAGVTQILKVLAAYHSIRGGGRWRMIESWRSCKGR
jgi:hypothetical protein